MTTNATKPSIHGFVQSSDLETLLRALDEYLSGFIDDVIGEATRAQVADIKDLLAGLLVGRVRLRTVQHVRQVTHGMFRVFGRRALSCLRDPEQAAGKGPLMYFSSIHLVRPDYFESPFIGQMAVHRDIALRNVLPDEADRVRAVGISRVAVIPERYLPRSPTDESRTFWATIGPHLDRLEKEGPVVVVKEGVLRRGGGAEAHLDFGLYSTTAVCLYLRNDAGEELILQGHDSETFVLCQRQWDRYMHPSSEAVEWSTLRRTVMPEVPR